MRAAAAPRVTIRSLTLASFLCFEFLSARASHQVASHDSADALRLRVALALRIDPRRLNARLGVDGGVGVTSPRGGRALGRPERAIYLLPAGFRVGENVAFLAAQVRGKGSESATHRARETQGLRVCPSSLSLSHSPPPPSLPSPPHSSLAEQLGGVVPSPHNADKIWLMASSVPALAPSAAAAGSGAATVSAPSPDVEGHPDPFFDEAGLTQVIGPLAQHLGLRGAAPLAALPTAAQSVLSAFVGTVERAAQGAEASALAQAAAAAQRMPGHGGQLKVSGENATPPRSSYSSLTPLAPT